VKKIQVKFTILIRALGLILPHLPFTGNVKNFQNVQDKLFHVA